MERLVESGEIESHAEAARRLGITRARMSQVLALLNLSPAFQEDILSGILILSDSALRSVLGKVCWQIQQWSREMASREF